MRALAWIGARAQWALALGVVVAFFVPGPGEILDGTIPFWVALLTGLGMLRIDLKAVALRALAPRRLVGTLGLLALLMLATPAAFAGIGRGLGLDENVVSVLVYTASAPPLGSATAFCLMLGLDAAFALEITVLGSFLAPFTMPLVARVLLGEAVPIDVAEMTLRLAILIGSAGLGAVVARRLLGARRIERHGHSFDGLAVLCLMLFLFPLFLGLRAEIGAEPAFAALVLGLAVAANLGMQIVSLPLCRLVAGPATGGSAALIWGNRNAALALAAVPGDPVLTLYVSLYQVPMYLTPLIMRPFAGIGHRPQAR
ncbi:MAG: hypothetical protein AAGB15_11510 [Pseudomonadota bacterium]